MLTHDPELPQQQEEKQHTWVSSYMALGVFVHSTLVKIRHMPKLTHFQVKKPKKSERALCHLVNSQ